MRKTPVSWAAFVLVCIVYLSIDIWYENQYLKPDINSGYPEIKFALGMEPDVNSSTSEPSERLKVKLAFRNYIEALQNPKECNDTKFLILAPQMDGLGSWLNRLLNGIIEGPSHRLLCVIVTTGLAYNRTNIFLPGSWWRAIPKHFCEERSIACYFEPITSCPYAWKDLARPKCGPVGSNLNERYLFQSFMHKPALNEMKRIHPEFSGLYAIDAFSEIIRYFFRPNPILNQAMAFYHLKMSLPNSHYLSVHIRKGDKAKLSAAENVGKLEIERYLKIVDLTCDLFEYEYVFLTSDSLQAYEIFENHSSRVNGKNTTNSKATWNLHYINISDFDNPDAFKSRAAAGRIHTEVEAALVELTNFLILARATSIVGGFYSNLERMGMLFQLVFVGEPHVIDIEGGQWYIGSWMRYDLDSDLAKIVEIKKWDGGEIPKNCTFESDSWLNKVLN